MQARYQKYILNFKRPSGTSRGVLRKKETWFLILEENKKKGIGECGLLRGLSADDRPDYEEKLGWVCSNISLGREQLYNELWEFPSIQFGLEQAFTSLNAPTPFSLFPSNFSKGKETIPINGLIWMGGETYMRKQIDEKLKEGFRCIKMKIGALDFDREISLLEALRKKYPREQMELRVDANGAFSAQEVLTKLKRLAALDIHSIEQPIKPGQSLAMKKLCKESPLPIALDEELIGIFNGDKKEELLRTISPQYIILKPSFIGGYQGAKEWIRLAKKYGIGWWVTSALESNIGLNAIAQWTYTLNNTVPQGLGTGALFSNNFDGPLTVEQGRLHHKEDKPWKVNL
ncbi:MAG: o-succinylbenzoate synthase [Bacteroidota bacterium]